MQVTTSPAARWATEGTEYPHRGDQPQEAWSALQIAQSNGAYGGRTVQFVTPDGLVSGELVRAGHSSENPGHVLILTGDIRNRVWSTIPNDTTVLVMR